MKKKTSIVFTGDIGFDRYMDRKWEDEGLLSQEILDFFHSADHVVANVEGAMINGAEDAGGKGIYFHTMNPAAAVFFERIRTDIFCLANNHAMDVGRAGVESTKRIAAEMGCKTVGAGIDIDEASSPVYLPEAGGIGMIAVGYQPSCVPATETEAGCFNWADLSRIEARVKEIKEKCRWCIVIVHGGEEFAPIPSPYTRERYHAYIRMGADIVVGHHPHVAENYEMLENGEKAIFYSLGNFIFDTDNQRKHLYTEVGILLKLIFTEECFSFEAIGTLLDRENEHIGKGALPAIFANIPEKEYVLLAPLGAWAFMLEEKPRIEFLLPDEYGNATEEKWLAYFKKPRGYVKGEHNDFDILLPLARESAREEWKKSTLTEIKDYICKLL